MATKPIQRRFALAEADLHSFHKLGLCNPDTLVMDADTGTEQPLGIGLGEFQRYMWERRQEYINNAFDIIGARPCAYLMVGDVTHGNGHSEQLMGSRISDQYAVAHYNLLPIVERRNVRQVRLMTGTGVHSFGEGTSEIVVAARLREKFKRKDISVVGHGRFDIGGAIFDVAHHGPGRGSRWWLEGNTARYHLRDRMTRDLSMGKRPAHVYLYGHHHVDVCEMVRIPWQGETYRSYIVVLPSWCGLGEYARKVTRSAPVIENGLYLFEIVDGRVIVYDEFVSRFDVRIEETL